jgi:peptidoglycan L-alanyl-D-glutamate endopeptidase CwlK
MGSSYEWGERSLFRINTCHPLLGTLFMRVIKRDNLPSDITILCGYRDKAAQNLAFSQGASRLKWPKSKHNKYPSHAIDFAPYPIDWDKVERWDALHTVILDEWLNMVEEELIPPGVTLSWGGTWTTFVDRPHLELRGV